MENNKSRSLSEIVADSAKGTCLLAAGVGLAYVAREAVEFTPVVIRQIGPQGAAFFWGLPTMAAVVAPFAAVYEAARCFLGYREAKDIKTLE